MPSHPLLRLLLILPLLFSSLDSLALSASKVTHLPGFSGPLPFHLETGYVGVDEVNGVELFYYFLQSEGSPREDPLLLWLSGGPGCSALSGLVFEIGPLKFRTAKYNGSLPTLFYNPYSWTKVANIIFLDSPVGTGFSFSRRSEGYEAGDITSSKQVQQFLKKWFVEHPQFLSNPLYIAGDSYAGKVVPVIAQEISQGFDAGYQALLNLKGYLIGNPFTNETFDIYSRIPYAHGVGIISDEFYESYAYYLSYYWANNYVVREALHIKKGTISEWQRCSKDLKYTKDIPSSLRYHRSLTTRGYRALVFSGDHDLLVPFSGTQAWIRSLKFSIVDDWRSWHVGSQVAGYTRTYSNNLTFATVKGAGHTAPEYRPKECLEMARRWLSYMSL